MFSRAKFDVSVFLASILVLLTVQVEIYGKFEDNEEGDERKDQHVDNESEENPDEASSSTTPPPSNSLENQDTECAEKGDFEKDIRRLNNNIVLDPNSLTYYKLRALYHSVLGETELELADHEKCLELEPNNVMERFLVAWQLFDLDRFDEAEEHLQEVFRYVEDEELSNEERYEMLFQLKQALEEFEKMQQEVRREEEILFYKYCRNLIIEDARQEIAKILDDGGFLRDESKDLIMKIRSARDHHLAELKLAFARYSRFEKTGTTDVGNEETNASIEELEKDLEMNVPEYLCDKITYEIMKDPVVTPSGITYERVEIIRHLEHRSDDPMSRAALRPDQLRANTALKEAIEDFICRHELS